ncbi:MAG: D-alanyl-D-alanine carboxypeptidase, partial [Oscillospiraceae bacterium]|nr:D-alanyl-D-alanine carboxypeptidase [Oscillospiraceae bacterium]
MKRMISLFIVAGVLLIMMPTAFAVGTSASAAILMEWESGRVLYEKNAHQPREIASITKLMTALVALESGHDLLETVTIDSAWTGIEGSSIYLKPGETVSLETLLYGMMLRSGNDAALASAGYCGGTVEQFVAQMNRRAKGLGMVNTSFANPHGLNAENHYSTAYDMALLASACLKNGTLADIVSTKTITLGTRTFTNHNKLLWRFDGCIGLKTGYTEKAGRTLVSAARRDGMTLICVTLNAPDDWSDHEKLFEYGFSEYKVVRAGGEGVVCRIPTKDSLLSFCFAEV